MFLIRHQLYIPTGNGLRRKAALEDDALAFMAGHKGNKTGAKTCFPLFEHSVKLAPERVLAVRERGLVRQYGGALRTDTAQGHPLAQSPASRIIQVADPRKGDQPDGVRVTSQVGK